MTSPNDPRADNLALWEGLAAVHAGGIEGGGTGGYYDVDALVAGKNPIHAETDVVLAVAAGPDGVAGLDVLHVQSHIGIDSVELARRGARVTCTDFSPTALARAADLAERSGVRVDTVVADSTALPEALHGRFDLAYVTIGAICWIDDLDAWMRSVAACLRPGGSLFLYGIHPLRQMTDTLDPLVFDMSYTFTPDGLTFDEDGSYADPTAKLPATKGTVYSHSIGETVNAAIGAGLTVEHLVEHTDANFDAMGEGLVQEDDGLFRWRHDGGMPMPIAFGLVARKS